MSILPSCKDPSLTALTSKGYNVVQLPRADLQPTQLLVEKNRRLQRLGELLSVFIADPNGQAVPPIKPDQPSPNIKGAKSADLEVGVGLNILRGLISALGGSTLGIDFAYSKAGSVQFEFTSTLENSTELAIVDMFLASSRVNPYARAVAEMLDDDKVYVITSTLKASRISVAAKDTNKQTLSIDVPVIQTAIGGNIKVERAASDESVVTFEGAVPLVFGFQAVKLVFDNGRYRTLRLVDAGDISAESATSAGKPKDGPVYLESGVMLFGSP